MKSTLRYWKIRAWFWLEVADMVLDFATNQYAPENMANAKALFKETLRFAWDGTAGPILLSGGKFKEEK